ncbi:Eco57I restriction-modification methylase domain-containing protein [Nostocoides sp.]
MPPSPEQPAPSTGRWSFPHVFATGGFDVVLGNPPWERIKLQEQEFFAARSPAIATAANKAARDRLIKSLALADEGTPDRALYDEFQQAKRLAEASSEFMRLPEFEDFTGKDRVVRKRPLGGRFPLTGRGDVNTYALFAELFARLTGPKGRSGVIVPTGIATDATTAPFFADLVAKQRLSQLVDFENRAGLFPAVDSRMKFCLLTLGRNEPLARFAFFLTEPSQLAEPERNFTLSPAQIARLNPNTRTAPVFRSRKDAELTARIYNAAPVLIEEAKGEEGNPWNMTFHTRIWHMAEDSEWFRTAAQLTAEGLIRDGVNWRRSGPAPTTPSETFVPLYEAKMTLHFDHRAAGYGSRGDDRGYRVLPETTEGEHQDPLFEPEPFYWVLEAEVERRLSEMSWSRGWLTGWKDVTSNTNERTAIFSIVPRVAVGHSMPLMFPGCDPSLVGPLIANLSAMVLDYVARIKVSGLHLTSGNLKQFPILPPSFYTPEKLAFLTPRVLELTYTSHALAPFAADLGHDGPPFPWDDARRATLRADLDAFFARAYRLSREDLAYILDPADVMGEDYPSETFRVLKEKETRSMGEYRTRRLVLKAWDRMEADGTFAGMGM